MDNSCYWPVMYQIRCLSSRLAWRSKAGAACKVTLHPHYLSPIRSLGRLFSWEALLLAVGNLASGWGYAALAGAKYAWGASWIGVVLGVIVAHTTALGMVRSSMFGVAFGTVLGVALSTVGGVTEGIALGVAGGTAPAVLLVGTALAVARGMGEEIAAGVAFGVAWGSSYGVTVALCLWHAVKERSALTQSLHG